MNKKEKSGSKVRLIRVCVLGASFSGKSTLCNRFVNNNFEWSYEPTLEVGIFRKLINITEDEEHKQYCMMQIEDLFPINHPFLQMPKETNDEIGAMMDYYDRVLGNKRSEKKTTNEKPLFKEALISGYIYVYDLTSAPSFEEVLKVIEYIHTREEKEAGKRKPGSSAKLLIGTKKDLVSGQGSVTQAHIDQAKKKFNLTGTKMVSALTNSGVKDAFLEIARNAIDLNTGAGEGHDSGSGGEGEGFFSFLGCGGREKDKGACIVS